MVCCERLLCFHERVTAHQGRLHRLCLNGAGGGVPVSRDLSIPTAIRKASVGILQAGLGTVIQERCELIIENADESKNNESLENLA